MNLPVCSRFAGRCSGRRAAVRCAAGLCSAVLLFVLCWPALALAEGFIKQQAWLEDPGEQMRWEDVQAAPMQVFSGVLNRGFSPAPLWLRLRIDPNADRAAGDRVSDRLAPDEQLILRIRPVYLDQIEVFDPLVGGYAGAIGDRHHPRRDAVQGTDFLFPIARGREAREVWLRLSTVSSRQIDVQLLRADQLPRAQFPQQVLASMYISTSLVLMIWGGVAGWLQRERVLALFGLMQLGGLLYGLSSLGFLRALWPL